MAHSLDDVIDGALQVLNSFGLEFCSMRRIAGELQVQPSALYHHVANKQSLLALMADRIIAPVQITDNPRASCLALREAMLSVRDGAEVVATARAFGLGVTDLPAALAQSVGSDEGAQALLLYVLGHTQATQTQRQAVAAGVITADPTLDDTFARGVDIILAGSAALA
ncbi:MAG: TetR family transcriptional regulator [Actinomycetales bacterium]|nr:TetR family transcriptional regulator [Actinomycetales bacterium]